MAVVNKEHVRFLQQLVDRHGQAFCVLGGDGQIASCNRAFTDLVGYTKEELVTLNYLNDLVPSGWRETVQELLAALRQQDQPGCLEIEHQRKDGLLVPVEISLHRVELTTEDYNEYFYAFVTDISERKRLQKALHQRETRCRAFLDAFPDAIFRLDGAGIILDYRAGHEVGADLLPAVFPGDG